MATESATVFLHVCLLMAGSPLAFFTTAEDSASCKDA
jgi:hypothetical protein